MFGLRQVTAGLLLLAALGLLGIVVERQLTAPEQGPSSATTRSSGVPSEVYPRRDWQDYEDHSLDISLFPFRDRNRNGRYDRGDMPLAGIGTVLVTPSGEERFERSNTNGYTNFSMRKGEGNQAITQPGSSYAFKLQIPPGWQVTTGNATQHIRFRELEGSPAGLVPERGPETVGLAPLLTVSGVLPVEHSGISFRLRGPGGELPLGPGSERAFEQPVLPGHWQLIAADGQSEHVYHDFEVAQLPVVLAAPRPRETARAPLPRRVVQTFDQHTRSVIEKLPAGDRGLSWDYLLATDNQVYGAPGFANALISGHAIGYNSSGHPVTISGNTPGGQFDFVGGYFGTAWPTAEGETLEVRAWRGDILIASDSLALSFLGPVWFQADYRGIDRLELRTSHYWQFAVDDMVFRLPGEAPRQQQGVGSDFERLRQTEVYASSEEINQTLCAPVVAANSLAAAGVAQAAGLAELAKTLASPGYMNTTTQRGTSVEGFIRGLKRYAEDRGHAIESLAYQGKADLPPWLEMGSQVSADWLRQALNSGMSISLNLGWYAPAPGPQSGYHRVGGHWVELLALEGRRLLIHDPLGESAGDARRTISLEPLRHLRHTAGGSFKVGDTGRPLLSNQPLPEGATLAALDAAFAWRLRSSRPG